jgi:Flp pilus assembly protein TadD
VIGLVQVGVQALADRYTYLPFVGLFVAIAWGADALVTRLHVPRLVPAAAGAVAVITWAIVAHQQVSVWASAETLWRHAVDVVPQSSRAHNSLGVAYGNSGRTAEAAEQFKIAAGLQLDVETAQDLFPNLGRALMSQGKISEAIPVLERARQVSPDRPDVWHQLGLAYFGANRKDDAMEAWKTAVRLNPRSDESFFMMGVVLAADRRFDEARQAFTQVLAINPSRQDARDMLKALGK